MFIILVDNITIKNIFDINGPIADLNENYKPRPTQIEASEKIDIAISTNANAMIEGGTGIGKSFAYLFPVIKNIAESGFKKKAVITTSGISLQEQLVDKDLPFAVQVMKSLYPNWPTEFSFTLLKGRQNFICMDKVDAIGLTHLPKGTLSIEYHDVYDFLKITKTGDLSDMNTVPSYQVLETISCTKNGECKRKDCSYFSDCFYTKHRNNVDKSSIIVTNYHMLYSNSRVGGSILPEYDILVFDEAHEASSIYREFDAQKISVNSILNFRNKVSELNNKTTEFKNIIDSDVLKYYVAIFESAFYQVAEKFGELNSPVTIDDACDLPETIFKIAEDLIPLFENVRGILEKMNKRCQNLSGDGYELDDPDYQKASDIQRTVSVMNDLLFGIIDFIQTLKTKIADDNEVVFVERINDVINIGNKKIEVGHSLNLELFSSEDLSCIFTSATISVNNNFEYIKTQLGLNFNKKSMIEFVANSPFDLEHQQLWYLPPNTCDGNKVGFDKYALSNMIEISDKAGGGSLCLFTSIKNMRNAKYEFQKELGHKYKILAQGDMPKSKLITEFRNDENSILLGTKSFFTGIDIQGSSLRCVLIDKFPFAQPTDPVQQKLRLKNNAFYNYSIPDMIILLKQAVGRGVRSVSDKCVISILDGRMSTSNYKMRIFNSFNYKKSSTRNVDDIIEFLK